jgi:hypothetical protein
MGPTSTASPSHDRGALPSTHRGGEVQMNVRTPAFGALLILFALGTLAISNVLVSAAWASSCPNEVFRTGPGANLPDCRAYEMVSPPDKNGGEVDGGPVLETLPAPEQAALNGEAVTYASQTTFTEANPLSSPLAGQYISQRDPTGWHTQAITPEQDFPGGVFDKNQASAEFSLFQGFSEDLSHGFVVANEPAPVAGAPAGYFNPYVRDNLNGAYQLLSTATPPVMTQGPDDNLRGLKIEYAGMSADGSHVVFRAQDALTPGALWGQKNLYEWSNGHLELVSEVDGKVVNGSMFGAFTPAQSGLNEGYNRVISADGSRVFWTDLENFQDSKLYMREVTSSGAWTVQVSASQKTNGEGPGGIDPEGPQPAHYVTASVDGNEVFFTSCEKLTNDSTAGPPQHIGYEACAKRESENGSERPDEDLYQYEASTGKLTDLTVDSIPGQTAGVVGVLGASEDGSYIYFVAHGALVAGAPSGPSSYNIYLWHHGGISLITTTGSEDYAVGGGAIVSGQANFSHGPLIDSEFLTSFGLSRASSNGLYLAFESSAPLTGYDNTPLQSGACESSKSNVILSGIHGNKTGRCIEVYEYNAASGRLTCASCSPRGLPPGGDSVVPFALHLISHPPGWQSTTVQQRYLLDDGRLFFDSTDALLPQASNAGELNVYEREPEGVGSCQREGGCLFLISSGTSNEHSYFIDASASGNDVFFVTRQQLVAQDGDEALDMYDARVSGGFLAPVPPPCGGEACRPPVTSAPAIYGAPPSATFAGAGNPPQPTVQSGSSKAKAKKKLKQKKSKRKHQVKKMGKKGARGSHARRSIRGSHR